MMKNKRIISILVLIIVVLIFMQKCTQDKKVQSKYLIEALSDKLNTWKNKNGEIMAKIQVIQTDKARQFLKIESQDEEIKNLQVLVKEYKSKLKKGGSATSLETEVRYDTTLIIKYDTIGICNFSDSIQNEYLSAKFNLKDSIFNYSFSYRDSFNIIVGNEKTGLFKSRPFVEVKSTNPYSEIKSLRTYQVSDIKTKRFGLGPSVGVGIDKTLTPTIYVGIGFNMNLIRF